MQCPRCRVQNDAGARFYEDCGVRLEAACPSCGTPVTPGKKFCRSCGAALTPESSRFTSPESYTPKHLAEKILTSKSALEGERKQVTVLFADLKGSMELLADRDPEEARKILDPVLERRCPHWTACLNTSFRITITLPMVLGDKPLPSSILMKSWTIASVTSAMAPKKGSMWLSRLLWWDRMVDGLRRPSCCWTVRWSSCHFLMSSATVILSRATRDLPVRCSHIRSAKTCRASCRFGPAVS